MLKYFEGMAKMSRWDPQTPEKSYRLPTYPEVAPGLLAAEAVLPDGTRVWYGEDAITVNGPNAGPVILALAIDYSEGVPALEAFQRLCNQYKVVAKATVLGESK